MPEAMLDNLHKQFGVPLPKIEKMWEKAKLVVEKQSAGKKNYALVVHILKNMVRAASKKSSVSKVWLSEAAQKANSKVKPKKKGKAPDWWTKLSAERQSAYLKMHRNSSMVGVLKENLKPIKDKKAAPSAETKAKSKPTGTDSLRSVSLRSVVDTRTESEVEADKKEVARQEKVAETATASPVNPTQKQRSVFRNLFSAGSKAIRSVHSSVKTFIGGPIERANDALQRYSEAEDNKGSGPDGLEDDEEPVEQKKSKAMGILGKIAVAALVAGIGVGVFMLAPSFAPTLAEMYFAHGRSLSASSKFPTTVDDLTKDFVDWLSHQDVEKLVAEHKGESK